MRTLVFVLVFVVALGVWAACSSPPEPVPPKKPNTELIVGDFERHKPDGETAFSFRGDGSLKLAKNKAELEHTPHLADGTWKLDGDQLTLSYDQGQCQGGDAKVGVYKVVISKVGVRFTKVNDSCADRSRLDGQTWWRIR
jgi:hypothetical protein